MYRNWTAGIVIAINILIAAGAARAAAPDVAGLWIYKGDGIRIDMELRADGQCVASAVAGTKKSVVTGTYKLEQDALLLTPKKGPPIQYSIATQGNQMTLAGGDFGEGNALTFSKREVATGDEPAGRASVVAVAAAEPPKETEKEKKEEARLPGGKWDLKVFEQHFTTVKVTQDSVKNTVIFLMQRKDEGYMSFDAAFYDEDDVKLGVALFDFDPTVPQTAKGERTRGTLTLLPEATMKKVVKVVVNKH